jgi:hypothetical protein
MYYVARPDSEGVEPEAAPRTARNLLRIGVALLLVVGEHDHAKRSEATDLRPQLMPALGTRGHHPLMFARQRLGVLDSKVQSSYTLRAILIQLVCRSRRLTGASDPYGSLRSGTFGEDVQHHYPDHDEADTDQTRRT